MKIVSTKINNGWASIILGIISWLVLFYPPGLTEIDRYASAAIAIVGAVVGSSSVNTKLGTAGMFINLLSILYAIFFIALWLSFLNS